MWEHFQEGVQPHAEIMPPAPAKDLSQKWFDPQWRAEYLDWYVAHSSLKADILPVANTQLGPGSLAAILGGVFEGGEDTIWIHPNPDFTDEIVFNPEHPNWILHKELLKACKAKANGHYFVGMPDLMEGLDVLAALKGTDRVLLDTVMQPEILEQQMQQINDIYFKVFDELYDIIREGDEMAFCYFSSWAPGKMSKLQSDISTMISQDDYRRFVQPFIREQCQKIDYTLYHLDGVGAMHHLPALLEIEELNAIQWTPGVGEPQGGSPKWYDLYKKILAGRFTEEDQRYAQHQADAQAAVDFIDGQNFGVDSVGAAALAEGEDGPATRVQRSKDAPSGDANAGDHDADTSTGHETAPLMQDSLNLNPNVQHYGDGRATIWDLGILDQRGKISNVIVKGETFSIKERIRFNAPIAAPIFTFTIKDKRGADLTGTNTLIEGCDIQPVKAGDEYTCTFTQRMTLQGGEYLLSMSCTGFEEGEHVVYDRKYDVASITVLSNKNTVGVYDMESEVTLERREH